MKMHIRSASTRSTAPFEAQYRVKSSPGSGARSIAVRARGPAGNGSRPDLIRGDQSRNPILKWCRAAFKPMAATTRNNIDDWNFNAEGHGAGSEKAVELASVWTRNRLARCTTRKVHNDKPIVQSSTLTRAPKSPATSPKRNHLLALAWRDGSYFAQKKHHVRKHPSQTGSSGRSFSVGPAQQNPHARIKSKCLSPPDQQHR